MVQRFTTDEKREMLRVANVKFAYWKKTLPEYGQKGQELRAYLLDNKYRLDIRNGIGGVIVGNATARTWLLGAFARELVLCRDNILVVDLVELGLVADPGFKDVEYIRKVSRVDGLVINQFQGTTDSPFNYFKEQYFLEKYLTDIILSGKRIYFASPIGIEKMTWWSDDFKDILKQRVRVL